MRFPQQFERLRPFSSPLREAAPSRPVRMAVPAPVVEEPGIASLGCIIRLSIINELREKVLAQVPMDRNILVANSILKVFDDAALDCEDALLGHIQMMEEEYEEEEIDVRSAALECLEPGYCNMFSRKRRAQCMGAQRSGVCYRPGQFDRDR